MADSGDGCNPDSTVSTIVSTAFGVVGTVGMFVVCVKGSFDAFTKSKQKQLRIAKVNHMKSASKDAPTILQGIIRHVPDDSKENDTTYQLKV